MNLSETDIFRMLRDLLGTELARKRGRHHLRIPLFRNDSLTDPRWGVDSLERMELAGIVNGMFHLYRTGLEDNLLRYKTLDRWVELVSVSWKEHPETISFRTSGSTGTPEMVSHRTDDLVQEAAELARLFSGCRRIVSFVPSHHIYGFLFTILLPHVLDVPVIEAGTQGIGKLREMLTTGDLLISFPANWAWLDASLPDWPAGLIGVTSTGPADPDLLRRLQNKGVDIIEIYGSSETGGIGFRRNPSDAYTLFPYWRRSEKEPPPPDAELVRTDARGRGGETVLPPDVLDWESDTTFRPVRRRDHAVQVGGVNVYPEKIGEKICTHPGVKECAVRLMTGSEIPRLKAWIVPASGESPERLRDDLERWLYEQFSAPERPVHLTFSEKLPVNAMGKPSDW